MSAWRACTDHPTMVHSSTRYLRTELMIGMVVLWCVSGLVAVDMSILVPTAFSPVISKLASPIVASVAAVLVVAPFATHATGIASFKTYRFWQFFHGGSRFICAQTTGWSLYGAALILIGFWIVDQLTAVQSSRSFICPPGFLITIAVFSLAGNAALLCSLHLYKEKGTKGEQTETARTVKGMLLERSSAVLVLMVLVVVLLALLSQPEDEAELLSPHSLLHSGSAVGHPETKSGSPSRRLSLAVNAWLRQLLPGNASFNGTRLANNASHDVSATPGPSDGHIDGHVWNQVAVSAVILAVVLFNCCLVCLKRRHSHITNERRAKLLDGTIPGVDRHLDGTVAHNADYEAALPASA